MSLGPVAVRVPSAGRRFDFGALRDFRQVPGDTRIGAWLFHTTPYRIGGGVTAPRALYDPEPEYSDEARKAKFQGIAILQVVIDAEGRPRDVRIARSAGMGVDEKAIEAVRHWRFEPGTLNGKPVAVAVNVEANFRLY